MDKVKTPKRIVHCSDGIYEEYSEDEGELLILVKNFLKLDQAVFETVREITLLTQRKMPNS